MPWTTACRRRAPRGVAVRGVVRVGVPAEEIVRAAEAEGAAMIVMGTHGRGGVQRLMVGSVVDRVLRTATCPLLLVRDTGPVARAA
jgi:nucleotide-binding universal stress UspA family protein